MGDKARIEIEELYLGIPDDSVNLTFRDLASVEQMIIDNKKSSSPQPIMEPIQESSKPGTLTKQNINTTTPLHKLPSLDFSKGLQATKQSHDHHRSDHKFGVTGHGHGGGYHHNRISSEEFRQAMEVSRAYDDMSAISMSSMRSGGRSRRAGIPHSNICTICSTYIYFFRHRCLVCGRVYCKSCVNMGMGDMVEGRKCLQCLGRRFSQRYIHKAGEVGCCFPTLPSKVREAEQKWAEKGPRRTGERLYGSNSHMNPSTISSRSRSPVTPRTPNTRSTGERLYSNNSHMNPSTISSRSRSPVTPRTPTTSMPHYALNTPHSFVSSSNPHSFVSASGYPPYATPIHHHLPL